MSLSLDISYRRYSDASMNSARTESSMASPTGPPTPADSFGGYPSRKICLDSHGIISDGLNIIGTSGQYNYMAELGDHSWQLAPEDHMHAEAHDSSMDSFGPEEFCRIGDDDPFRFSKSFSTDISQDLEFSNTLTPSHSMADLVSHGMHAYSSNWSPGSSDARSTVSPTETFHVPEIASASSCSFDQIPWEVATYHCLNIQTPPLSPQRPMLRRRTFKATTFETPVPTHGVRSGRVQKSRSITASPSNTRLPCNEIIYIKAADGTTKPALDSEGNPKICTKTFHRAEHLTRHKKTDGHSRMESQTFCPVPDCKKSKNAEKPSAFGGARRDNLVDHFKKTHCQQSDHNGRNRRIERDEAELYGPFWLQVWDAAQPDQKLKELAKIWKPHGGHDQDPNRVMDFFIANDLRLTAAQLRKRLNYSPLEHRILNMLPPRGEQRSSKAGKCRTRVKRETGFR